MVSFDKNGPMLLAILALLASTPALAAVFGPSPHPSLAPVVAEAEQLLPPIYGQHVSLQLRLAALDSNPIVDQSRRVARYRNGTIDLHSGFVEAVRSPEGRKLLLASLIHEATHAFDSSPSHLTAEERSDLSRCQWEETKSSFCQELLSRKGFLSERATYLRLAGFLSSNAKSKNRLNTRSPDPYEFTNSREHFAVQAEHFFLDPTYGCRRPTLFNALSEIFKTTPPLSCQPARVVFTSQGNVMAPFDPSRVWEIHYLFASRGSSLMSRWGHAMFRVVQCAPHREVPGPECLNDVAHHVVVGFRGYVESSMVNYWNGLTGKYPSQLTIQSMSEVLEEYSRTELREVLSLPITLSPAQRHLLAARLQEIFWSYRGRYKFFTNNCASEADHVLKGVLPSDHRYQEMNPLSPLGMWDDLVSSRLIDPSILKDRASAQTRGHLFPSQREHLERAWKVAGSPGDSLDQYLQTAALDRRREGDLSDDQRAALYLLEKAILRKMKSQSDAVAIAALEKEGTAQLREAAALRQRLLPWNLPQRSWGIPLESELPSRELLSDLRTGLINQMAALDALLKNPELQKEFDATKENIKLLGR